MITSINEFKLIMELGEANIQPYQYNLEKNVGQFETTYKAYFSTDNYKYIVKCMLVSLSDYHDDNLKMSVSFEAIENNGETGENKHFQIMATVIAVIKDIIEKEPNVDIIHFMATYKDSESRDSNYNQRLKMYKHYVEKNIGDNWEISIDQNMPIITITKSL